MSTDETQPQPEQPRPQPQPQHPPQATPPAQSPPPEQGGLFRGAPVSRGAVAGWTAGGLALGLVLGLGVGGVTGFGIGRFTANSHEHQMIQQLERQRMGGGWLDENGPRFRQRDDGNQRNGGGKLVPRPAPSGSPSGPPSSPSTSTP